MLVGGSLGKTWFSCSNSVRIEVTGGKVHTRTDTLLLLRSITFFLPFNVPICGSMTFCHFVSFSKIRWKLHYLTKWCLRKVPSYLLVGGRHSVFLYLRHNFSQRLKEDNQVVSCLGGIRLRLRGIYLNRITEKVNGYLSSCVPVRRNRLHTNQRDRGKGVLFNVVGQTEARITLQCYRLTMWK